MSLIMLLSTAEQHAWSWNGVKELVSSMQKKTFMVGATVGAMAGYYLAKQRFETINVLNRELAVWKAAYRQDVVAVVRDIRQKLKQESAAVMDNVMRASCHEVIQKADETVSNLRRIVSAMPRLQKIVLFRDVMRIASTEKILSTWVEQLRSAVSRTSITRQDVIGLLDQL